MTQSGTVNCHRTPSNGLIFELRQPVNASADTIWRVMNDHPRYADVAANLSRVSVISGKGIGMIRECAGPKGESWRETCIAHEEGVAFDFRVHTEAADYPYPFSSLEGRWFVDTTRASPGFGIRVELQPKGNWIQKQLLFWVAPKKFSKVLSDLGRAWATRMERDDKMAA